MKTTILDIQSTTSLTIVQFATDLRDGFACISGMAALSGGLLEIKEVSEAGSVNQLQAINRSPEFVLLIDGDLLIGAKQNRVLNTSVLFAPHSSTIVPVSCVEQGRWHHVSAAFAKPAYTAPASLRALKSRRIRRNLRRGESFAADQGEVWSHLNSKFAAGTFSSTSDLGEVFSKKQAELESFLSDLTPVPCANGVAVFAGSDLKLLDCFHRTDLLAEYLPQIVRGSALETLFAAGTVRPPAPDQAGALTLQAIEAIDSIPSSSHPGVGAGTEKRFESDCFTGFALTYEEHCIHLALAAK